MIQIIDSEEPYLEVLEEFRQKLLEIDVDVRYRITLSLESVLGGLGGLPTKISNTNFGTSTEKDHRESYDLSSVEDAIRTYLEGVAQVDLLHAPSIMRVGSKLRCMVGHSIETPKEMLAIKNVEALKGFFDFRVHWEGHPIYEQVKSIWNQSEHDIEISAFEIVTTVDDSSGGLGWWW